MFRYEISKHKNIMSKRFDDDDDMRYRSRYGYGRRY